MKQPDPPITFEQFGARILRWALQRIEEDAQRREIPSKQVQNLICNFAIAYVKKSQEGK